MKTGITITYFSGESESFTASTPEFVKWERKTGLKVTQLGENVGLDDLLFLAYNAKKRELGGQPIKPYDQKKTKLNTLPQLNSNSKIFEFSFKDLLDNNWLNTIFWLIF